MRKPNRFVANVIVVLAIPVLLIAVAASLGLSAVHTKYSRCLCCSAHLTQTLLMGIPVSSRATSSELSRYWIQSVDPSHEHTWVSIYGNDNFGYGRHCDYVHGSHVRWMLKDEVALCIMKALHSTTARKQFMNDLWGAGTNMPKPERDRLFLMIVDFGNAYHENPNRKDWPSILKKHGYN